jgi:hypothetical protein
MVEADSNLKLFPATILDRYKVFEHIHMLSMGIWQKCLTVIPTLPGSYFGVWVTCGVGMMSLHMVEADSHLKLLPASLLDICNVFEHIDMLSMGTWQ